MALAFICVTRGEQSFVNSATANAINGHHEFFCIGNTLLQIM